MQFPLPIRATIRLVLTVSKRKPRGSLPFCLVNAWRAICLSKLRLLLDLTLNRSTLPPCFVLKFYVSPVEGGWQIIPTPHLHGQWRLATAQYLLHFKQHLLSSFLFCVIATSLSTPSELIINMEHLNQLRWHAEFKTVDSMLPLLDTVNTIIGWTLLNICLHLTWLAQQRNFFFCITQSAMEIIAFFTHMLTHKCVALLLRATLFCDS